MRKHARIESGALDLDGCALDIGWGSAHGCYKATLKLRQRASTVGMSETAGRNGCIRAISRDTRISQNQSGLRRVAAASRAGSGTLCWLGAATRVSDTGAPQPSMSVGGWLTENHQRPVAAREMAQQSSAEALQQEAHPAARPVAAAIESGRGDRIRLAASVSTISRLSGH